MTRRSPPRRPTGAATIGFLAVAMAVWQLILSLSLILPNYEYVSRFMTVDMPEWDTDASSARNLENNAQSAPFFLREEASESCFVFEKLCVARRQGPEWFYFADDAGSARQPTVALNTTFGSHWGFAGIGEVDQSVNFSLSSSLPKQTLAELRASGNCSLSGISNHVVLHSGYNGMIGEFLMRSLLPLSQLMRGDQTDTPDIQFYVHLMKADDKLLDSHKLLMDGMSLGPEVQSWSHAVSTEKHSCRCYQRLALCGYRRNEVETSSPASGPAAPPSPVNDTSPLPILPSKALETLSLYPYTQMVSNVSCAVLTYPEKLKQQGCLLFANLRRRITYNLQRRYPSLSRDIAAYRTKVIRDTLSSIASDHPPSRRLLLQGDTHAIQHSDWKIIGLTQRLKRRKWLNLNETLSYCNHRFHPLKILCVEVNVEKSIFGNNTTENIFRRLIQPKEEQLLIHRSLDALVGIHGAQLTQGILLPSQATIVELLPWIPPNDYWGRPQSGRWTQQKHMPTPLGIIYHNVDLNHVGYSLESDSVPFCKNYSNDVPYIHANTGPNRKNETELEHCVMTTFGEYFRWDYRNFNVNNDMIESLVDLFIRNNYYDNSNISNETIQNDQHFPFCEHIQERSENNSFVQYNVWCQDKDGRLIVQHLYKS